MQRVDPALALAVGAVLALFSVVVGVLSLALFA
jgi:hypothetical protein